MLAVISLVKLLVWPRRAPKAQISLGITIQNIVWPIAYIWCFVECQAERTLHNCCNAIGTIQVCTAIGWIAQSKVSKLMWTLFGWLCRLQCSACFALNLDWIFAWKLLGSGFIVEQQSIRAKGFVGGTIFALHVCITLASDCIATIRINTVATEIFRFTCANWRKNGYLLHHQVHSNSVEDRHNRRHSNNHSTKINLYCVFWKSSHNRMMSESMNDDFRWVMVTT